ncbi:MAG: hypothetical protein ACLSA6_10230 [Holdemania massiliensis]
MSTVYSEAVEDNNQSLLALIGNTVSWTSIRWAGSAMGWKATVATMTGLIARRKSSIRLRCCIITAVN